MRLKQGFMRTRVGVTLVQDEDKRRESLYALHTLYSVLRSCTCMYEYILCSLYAVTTYKYGK
jgi:hypothetical protein